MTRRRTASAVRELPFASEFLTMVTAYLMAERGELQEELGDQTRQAVEARLQRSQQDLHEYATSLGSSAQLPRAACNLIVAALGDLVDLARGLLAEIGR